MRAAKDARVFHVRAQRVAYESTSRQHAADARLRAKAAAKRYKERILKEKLLKEKRRAVRRVRAKARMTSSSRDSDCKGEAEDRLNSGRSYTEKPKISPKTKEKLSTRLERERMAATERVREKFRDTKTFSHDSGRTKKKKKKVKTSTTKNKAKESRAEEGKYGSIDSLVRAKVKCQWADGRIGSGRILRCLDKSGGLFVVVLDSMKWNVRLICRFQDGGDDMIVVKGRPSASTRESDVRRITLQVLPKASKAASKHIDDAVTPPTPPPTTTSAPKDRDDDSKRRDGNVLMTGILRKPGQKTKLLFGATLWRRRKFILTKGLQLYSAKILDASKVMSSNLSEAKHILDMSLGRVRVKWIESDLSFEIFASVPSASHRVFRAENTAAWAEWKTAISGALRKHGTRVSSKKKKKKKKTAEVSGSNPEPSLSTRKAEKRTTGSTNSSSHAPTPPISSASQETGAYVKKTSSSESSTMPPPMPQATTFGVAESERSSDSSQNWVKYADNEGNFYWYNHTTYESVWDTGEWG
eukprot:g3426.t1